jgi:peptide/nickel transport system permease protein
VKTLELMSKRLLWALIIVIGVGSIAFVMERKLPGDPVRLIVGPQAHESDVQRARKLYGLDESTATQYVRFWERIAHLSRKPAGDPSAPEHTSCANPVGELHIDLGVSYRNRKPVTQLIADKAPRSFELAIAALLLQLLLGVGIGVFSASKRGTWMDQLAIGASLIGVSAPTFVIGVALQYVLAHKLGWLPHDGYGATSAEQLRSMILPALTLGLFGAALYARLTRDEVTQALAQDYVRTARAKGASESRIVTRHALRNALIPLATLMALDLGSLVGGAIVTEKLFRWPGMGALAVDAMVNRDGPVIFGTVLFSAFAIVVASVLVDVLTVALDPRIRRDG